MGAVQTFFPTLSGILSPISNALFSASVSQDWRHIPDFMVFFAALFGIAFLFWNRFAYLDRMTAFMLASCTMSSVHSMVCIVVGYDELTRWPSFTLDLPNTPAETMMMQFSFGYMLIDFIYMVILTPDDYIFLGHHVVSCIYLFAVLHNKVGAITAILTFFLGELTAPCLNVYTISKTLRPYNKTAALVFVYASPVFTTLFLLVRSFIAPVLVGWFLHTLWFRTDGIPGVWRGIMGGMVFIGILGSQLWSWKLVRGVMKRRRRRLQLLAELKVK